MIDLSNIKRINIVCDTPLIKEFPEMLFGTSNSNGKQYFNATKYNSDITADEFVKAFGWQIESVCKSLGATPNDCFVFDQNGDTIIDSTLAYLYISFVEQDFLGYMLDRISELFSSGVCVSDTYLYNHTSQRFSQEAIKEMLVDDNVQR